MAGMLPLALALTKTGAADMVSSAVNSLLHGMSPVLTAAAMFLCSALLTQAVSGAAVAAIMAPIAVSAAAGAGAPPQALAMAVALGSSMAFLTPLGHPVNTLVMGAGGYRFRDYRRVGWPLFLILTAVGDSRDGPALGAGRDIEKPPPESGGVLALPRGLEPLFPA